MAGPSGVAQNCLRARLTGRAARFIGMLQDFGHLDDERGQEFFVTLSEIAGAKDEEAIVDLPVVRRVAAAILFGHGDPEALRRIESGELGEDWPLLFS